MLFISGALLSSLLLFGVLVIHESQEAISSDIGVGSSLTTDASSSWLSPSGRFAFGFYPEGKGFLIGIQLLLKSSKTTVVWTARQDVKQFSKKAILTLTNGGLLLSTPGAGTKAYALFKFDYPASSAAMLDNGNFVIYSLNSSVSQNYSYVSLTMPRPTTPGNSYTTPGNPYNRGTFPGNIAYKPQCNSSCQPISRSGNSTFIAWRSFDYPTDTILGGQTLPCNHNLTSAAGPKDHSIGAFVLNLQCDGNLVSYAINSHTKKWDSGTSRSGYWELVLSEAGRLYLNTNGDFQQQDLSWYTPPTYQEGMLYAATLDIDNTFRLYAVNLSTSTNQTVNEIPYLKNHCLSRDICGVNSYCELAQNEPVCYCMPGFDYINGSALAEGCRRILALPRCKTGKLSMKEVDNIVGLDELAYTVVSTASSGDCSSACVDDCDCYAAIFREQKCSMLKMPLSPGRKEHNNPVVAFVKLAVEAGPLLPVIVTRKRDLRVVAITVSVLIAGVICSAVVAACGGAYWYLFGRFRKQWERWELALAQEIAPRFFAYDEIIKHQDKEKFSGGGQGNVYIAKLRIGVGRETVAVKHLHGTEAEAEKDFKAEMSLIGRARHVNVVSILGFCHDGLNRLLVYEYMHKGSLADKIFKPPRIRWALRLKLLLGVARGIHYLHRECSDTIIHRDIKPENIVISRDWTAKICDFGLIKHVSANKITQGAWTRRPGTDGYIAPECQTKDDGCTRSTITLPEKMDVYSYGVVVLEAVCCKRGVNLAHVRSAYDADTLSTLLDDEHVDAAQLKRVVLLGILCVGDNPDARPSMEEVVIMLEELMPPPSITIA